MDIPHSYALAFRRDTNRLLRRWVWLSRVGFSTLALLSDVAVIVGMAWLTGVIYHLAAYRTPGDMVSFLEVGALSATIFIMPNVFRGEYALPHYFSLKPHLRRCTQLWNATFVCLLAFGFLAQVSAVYSRGWMILYYAAALGALLATRYAFVKVNALATRAGLISTLRLFLFGTGKYIEDFVTRHPPRTFGAKVVGCHFLRPVDMGASPSEQRESLDRDLNAALGSARDLEPDAIIVLMPWSAGEAIRYCAEAFLQIPAEIHLGPESVLDRFQHVELCRFGTMATVQLTRLPLSRLEQVEKRVFDLLFASLALLLLTPLLVLVGVLIKLDSPGPIFFLQHRLGFNQKPFRIFKFRTMRTLDDGPSITQAKKNDPRVTRVGAWLRRWNLDELPQLFNVVIGDMSLVGPRPHAIAHDREFERLIALYARRHNVKPGITGWAQIHGFRGETDTEEKMRSRVEHDLYYIDNWSLWLDLQILVRTVFSRKSYRNAH